MTGDPDTAKPASDLVRERATRSTASDPLISTIKAAMSAVPTVGGAIASMISDRLQFETERAIYATLEILAKRVDQLGERIDESAIDRDDFLEMFKSCYLIAVRSHRRERHVAAANLLANLLLREDDDARLSYTELDHFVRCVDSLSVGALECLGTLYQLTSGQISRVGHSQQVVFRSLQKRLPAYAPDLLMGLVRELDSANLVHLSGAPDIKTENYGNYPLYLTEIGARFVERILQDFTA